MNDIPRRNRLDRMVPAELAIRAAIQAVEDMPADFRLTDAVIRLGRAQERVADFVDGVNTTADIDEPCQVCGKPQANGVWVCDLCLDYLKTPRPPFDQAAFDQAHGLPPKVWPWPLFLCPGYKRSDFTQLTTCKYCGHRQEEHGIGTSGGAVDPGLGRTTE